MPNTARSARRGGDNKPKDATRALQDALHQSAKHDPKRKFHALYDKVYRRDILERAYQEVRSKHGAPGVDKISFEDIESSGVDAFLDRLAQDLRLYKYRPAPLRAVSIPKEGQPGRMRELHIPTIRDRVAMKAAAMVLGPIFEADFLPASFGFRPGRQTLDALEAVRKTANNGRDWVLDCDLSDAFGSIDHKALMVQLSRRVVDRQMLKLIRAWLRTGVFKGGALINPETGTAQGSPISPLLCNVALHVLDETWAERHRHLGVLVRYADDLLAITWNQTNAEHALETVKQTLAPLGLHVSPQKTKIVCIAGGKQGVDFLGWHLRKVPSRKKRGSFFLTYRPSKGSMNRIRAKIRHATARSKTHRPLAEIVEELNPIIRGWTNHFRWGRSSHHFAAINRYVHERLAIFASRKHARQGRNWDRRYNLAWITRLGVYHLSGTRRYESVYELR